MGSRDVFGEGSGTVNADPLRFGAEMSATSQTVATATADDVTFTADDFSRMKVGNV
jgi:hypothetical protein